MPKGMPDNTVPEWGRKNPNLYGLAGAAYETALIPGLRALGMLLGGTAGTAAGPAGTAIGAGGGDAAAKRLAQGIGVALGSRQPENIVTSFANTATDFMEGTKNAMGGMIGAKVALPFAPAQVTKAVQPAIQEPKSLVVVREKPTPTRPFPANLTNTSIAPSAKSFAGMPPERIALIAQTRSNIPFETPVLLKGMKMDTGLQWQGLPVSPASMNIKNGLTTFRNLAETYGGLGGIPESRVPMAYEAAMRLQNNVNKMGNTPADQSFLKEYGNEIDPLLRYFGLIE